MPFAPSYAYAMARGSGGACVLAAGLWVNAGFAQTTAPSAPPEVYPPDPYACSPTCAQGFDCVQGFCIAAESKQHTAPNESIAAPGLALGAPSPAGTPSSPAAATSGANARARRGKGASVKGTDPDDDNDNDDTREGVEDWSDYRHQGFYLRVGLGAGLAWVRDPEFFGPGPRSADLIGDFEFSIGGTLGPVAFGYRGLVLPDVTTFSGGFVDVYPDVLEGLHVEASAGLTGFTDDFGATLGIGHDFFFAPEWSIGVTVRGLRSFGTTSPITTLSLSVSILCH